VLVNYANIKLLMTSLIQIIASISTYLIIVIQFRVNELSSGVFDVEKQHFLVANGAENATAPSGD
jgi:hypothetical protein